MAQGTSTIIVGAGSGGGVAASRLSEDPDHEVVLVEAGPFYETDEEIPAHLQDALNPQLEGHDWGFDAYFVEPPEAREKAPYPRGRLVGGSSAVNATLAQRGGVDDFDSWAAMGFDAWAWDKVMPAYMRMETDRVDGEAAYHGTTGPIPIAQVPVERWSSALTAFVKVCLDHGFPLCEDFNAPRSTGVGALSRNQKGTLRASTLVTYLREAQGRPNLEIRPETLVRRILFEGNRAVGIEVETGGEVSELKADRVVLSAGAIKTPQILVLSGVGPSETLGRLGIDQVVESAGVGRHLIDHPLVPFVARLADPTNPKLGLFAELRYTSEGGRENDLMVVAGVLGRANFNFDLGADDAAAVFLPPVVSKPKSRGWLEFTSTDPREQPELHLNFLSDPDDMRLAKEVTRLTYELAHTPPLSDELSEVLLLDRETVEDDDKLEVWLREMINTGYHSVGTCRMGADDDPEAVVDQYLAVRGAESLYIADASVMPEIVHGQPNLTCCMIGERVAEFLKDRTPAGVAGKE
jgi:choline dehydrogenase